ncbi:MAG: C40 family peptidase [Hymenobacter sp.]|nr:C40 family peptidase [Hymenobacter sp.]
MNSWLMMATATVLALCSPAAAARQEPANTPSSEVNRPPNDRTGDVLLGALSLVGVKYRYGGDSRELGFDCSGFVRHVFAESADLPLPRTSFEMSRLGEAVDEISLAPGDLVFYNTRKRRYSHVGIYLGDGRFIHSPSRGKQVEIVDMADVYWKKRFNGARRLLLPESQTPPGPAQ